MQHVLWPIIANVKEGSLFSALYPCRSARFRDVIEKDMAFPNGFCRSVAAFGALKDAFCRSASSERLAGKCILYAKFHKVRLANILQLVIHFLAVQSSF